MRECGKAVARRLGTPGFATRYFVGRGIDVGCGDDPLSLYAPLFPLVTEVVPFDREHGDAQDLASIPDGAFDFLHSSHCLEHVHDPLLALKHWARVVKPGGHLIVTVPDEDMYEQGVWPSTWNGDHKRTFTLWKAESWSPASVNLLDLIHSVGRDAEPIRVEKLESTFLPGARRDQTYDGIAESAIEMVLRRRPSLGLE